MKLLLAISFTLVLAHSAQSQTSNAWRNIRPLHSTRADVERLLGPPGGRCRCVYKAGSETVRIDYSGGPCRGSLSGWNVPADTVLRLNITPSLEQKFAELGVEVKRYIKITDDSFTEYYGDRNTGIRYTVAPTGDLAGISYFPTASDTRLRCPGFPAEDISIIDYKPFDQYFTADWDRARARLDNFAISLREKPDFKGYIIAYAGRRARRGEASTYANLVKSYLVNERGIEVEKLTAVDGGFREEFTIDLFLLPTTWPAPVPSPTIPPREVQVVKRHR